jgi:hypothetical protein
MGYQMSVSTRTVKVLAVALLVVALASVAVAAARTASNRAKVGVGSPLNSERAGGGREREPYAEGQILVRFKSGITAAQREAAYAAVGANVVKGFDIVPGLYQLKLDKGVTVEGAVNRFEAMPIVEYAQPNYTKGAAGSSAGEEGASSP